METRVTEAIVVILTEEGRSPGSDSSMVFKNVGSEPTLDVPDGGVSIERRSESGCIVSKGDLGHSHGWRESVRSGW